METAADRRDIQRVEHGDGHWAPVTIPHYGGPIGRAAAWYRAVVTIPAGLFSLGALVLRCEGADYKSQVYLNGVCVGTHEGFFAPFECDITSVARRGRNVLAIRLENDAVCQGNDNCGQKIDGDKIYAATGLGWDEPELGWHHCPPGMGLYGTVCVEARPALYVHDLWVRPLPEDRRAELWLEVMNTATTNVPLVITYSVFGQNFNARVCRDRAKEAVPPAGPGMNYYIIPVALPRFRWWDLATPWLYQAQVTVADPATGRRDTVVRQFGMRSFRQDTTQVPRGRFYLNGRSIRLRGANTMGHEQQCVLRGDMAQLRDDILLAKLCNMNFLRLTQRPVQREVYDMCDRLGLLTQTDLPLFAYLRRNQFAEAVRQAGEMERHVRAHPCNVLVTFINEPFPDAWRDVQHRHLTRHELARFFTAASAQVLVCNPDRVIKPVDGDYAPPGDGLPDYHCYTLWYVGHGLELGHLHAGHWMPMKKGWLYGCGEFGAEGLEDAGLMRRRYSPEWLPHTPADERDWTPARIVRAQTGDMAHVWFDRPQRLRDWVRLSQEYQAWAVRFQTEALRRDPRLISCALHLFIDAFPSGWMKTIMDCERRPKLAYFAYRHALAPLAVQLRADRWAWYGGEPLTADAWVCNDTHAVPHDARLVVQFERAGQVVYANEVPAAILPDDVVCQGILQYALPRVTAREHWTARIALRDARGTFLACNDGLFDVFPPPDRAPNNLTAVVLDAPGNGTGAALCRALGLRRLPWSALGRAQVILLEQWPKDQRARHIAQAVKAGARAILLELAPGSYRIVDSTVTVEQAGMGDGFYFASRATGHALVRDFLPRDFWLWTDETTGLFAPLLFSVAHAEGWAPVLTAGNGGWGRAWIPALAAAEKHDGKGVWRLVQLRLRDRLTLNPVARAFAHRLVLPARDPATET
ncbi:MAG: glycoside hydrolase family 2 [bacterium]|nr:glycoside hydrolase family 2 [bacterium]